jgi:hypothetical protein
MVQVMPLITIFDHACYRDSPIFRNHLLAIVAGLKQLIAIQNRSHVNVTIKNSGFGYELWLLVSVFSPFFIGSQATGS